MREIYLLLSLSVLGLIFGSFVKVLVRRIPDGKGSNYPFLEVITAIVFVVAVQSVKGELLQIAWGTFAVFGSALAAIDFEHHRLPNVLTYPLFVLGAGLFTADAIVHDRLHNLGTALISALALGCFYGVVHLLSRGGLGLGDAKLGLTIGLYAGYVDAKGAYFASMFAFGLGSLVALALIVTKKGGRKTALPFGPAMIIGLLIYQLMVPTFIF